MVYCRNSNVENIWEESVLAFLCSAEAECALWKRDILHSQEACCEHAELCVLPLQRSSWHSHFPWHSYKMYFRYLTKPQILKNPGNRQQDICINLPWWSHLGDAKMSASVPWRSVGPWDTSELKRHLFSGTSECGFYFPMIPLGKKSSHLNLAVWNPTSATIYTCREQFLPLYYRCMN